MTATTRLRGSFATWKSRFLLAAATLALVGVVVATAAEDEDDYDYYRARRAASKPWLMTELLLLELPETVHRTLVNLVGHEYEHAVPKTVVASPFTLVLVVLALANLRSWVSYHLSGSWVEASHILVKDTSPKTLKALVGLRDTLGTDGKMFGLTAKQYSQCPSAAQNGDLGRFGPGSMAPPFDALCFDPETPLNATLGPVQTQFGYHLIYIRTRKF